MITILRTVSFNRVIAMSICAFIAMGCDDESPDVGQVATDSQNSNANDTSDGMGLADDDASPLADDIGSIDAENTEVCPPGLKGCVDGELYICADDGLSFEQAACQPGTVCSDGACVACANTGDCEVGAECVEGVCEVPPLAIITAALPTAIIGVPYLTQVLATGGSAPYSWLAVDVESWPVGVSVGQDGQFGGVPQESGQWELEFEVTDSKGVSSSKTLAFEVNETGLAITTPASLPAALEGEPYSVTLAADGGTEPYFFGDLSPLPDGLSLGPGGVLSGVPAASGNYAFDIKVFDNGTPTLTAQKAFELSVDVAPLEIIGDNAIDLFITELYTLPLIVIVEGVPVPYSAQLSAKGGKKPYAWNAEPLPGFVQGFLPNTGIPDGLTLNPDGSITGGVSDPSLVVSVDIPFTGISLQGFFFAARVTDTQNPAQDETALYIIPTVPLGGF
jgi:hypothetical protein